jgi:hypothetical protein
MTIATRDQVIAAVDRALQLDPQRDLDAAMECAAQALALPVEAVQEAHERMFDEVKEP